MRKSAFVFVTAICAASVATSVHAEMLSSDAVTYTYGSESLLADPYSTVDYGTVETVYVDETAMASPSEYVAYQAYDEQYSVVEEPYVLPYETFEVDPSAATVFNAEYGQNAVVSEVIDGVVYETIVSTETPLLESGQIIQTY